jgi:hypothetical protein
LRAVIAFGIERYDRKIVSATRKTIHYI